ncbi:MAG TPA: hypothetical protein DCE41_09995 [Cytophagales bacterium]|nr:hypothetical protein [Cytophagales bacterium]HAP64771.1 hypothetical protein [Cytophagales bacterium]
MKRIIITTAAGQLSSQQTASLQALLVHHYKMHISPGPVQVLWSYLPTENIYHDYQLGLQSIVAFEGIDGLSQTQRVALFEAITQGWLQVTDQRIDQLVLSVPDRSVFQAMVRRNLQQVTLQGRFMLSLRLFTGLLRSRLFKGYYSFSSSY